MSRLCVARLTGRSLDDHAHWHTQSWTVLRSPFRHKRAQEAFERRDYRRVVTLSGDKAQVTRFLRFAFDTKPAEIGMSQRVFTHTPLEQFYRMHLTPAQRAELGAAEATKQALELEDVRQQLAALEEQAAEKAAAAAEAAAAADDEPAVAEPKLDEAEAKQ